MFGQDYNAVGESGRLNLVNHRLEPKQGEICIEGRLGGLNPSMLQNGAANELNNRSVLDSIWGLNDNVSLNFAGSCSLLFEPARPVHPDSAASGTFVAEVVVT